MLFYKRYPLELHPNTHMLLETPIAISLEHLYSTRGQAWNFFETRAFNNGNRLQYHCSIRISQGPLIAISLENKWFTRGPS